MQFVPKGPIDNKSALVHVTAWRRSGDKPLTEPMMAWFTDAYMRHSVRVNIKVVPVDCTEVSHE